MSGDRRSAASSTTDASFDVSRMMAERAQPKQQYTIPIARGRKKIHPNQYLADGERPADETRPLDESKTSESDASIAEDHIAKRRAMQQAAQIKYRQGLVNPNHMTGATVPQFVVPDDSMVKAHDASSCSDVSMMSTSNGGGAGDEKENNVAGGRPGKQQQQRHPAGNDSFADPHLNSSGAAPLSSQMCSTPSRANHTLAPMRHDLMDLSAINATASSSDSFVAPFKYPGGGRLQMDVDVDARSNHVTMSRGGIRVTPSTKKSPAPPPPVSATGNGSTFTVDSQKGSGSTYTLSNAGAGVGDTYSINEPNNGTYTVGQDQRGEEREKEEEAMEQGDGDEEMPTVEQTGVAKDLDSTNDVAMTAFAKPIARPPSRKSFPAPAPPTKAPPTKAPRQRTDFFSSDESMNEEEFLEMKRATAAPSEKQRREKEQLQQREKEERERREKEQGKKKAMAGQKRTSDQSYSFLEELCPDTPNASLFVRKSKRTVAASAVPPVPSVPARKTALPKTPGGPTMGRRPSVRKSNADEQSIDFDRLDGTGDGMTEGEGEEEESYVDAASHRGSIAPRLSRTPAQSGAAVDADATPVSRSRSNTPSGRAKTLSAKQQAFVDRMAQPRTPAAVLASRSGASTPTPTHTTTNQPLPQGVGPRTGDRRASMIQRSVDRLAQPRHVHTGVDCCAEMRKANKDIYRDARSKSSIPVTPRPVSGKKTRRSLLLSSNRGRLSSSSSADESVSAEGATDSSSSQDPSMTPNSIDPDRMFGSDQMKSGYVARARRVDADAARAVKKTLFQEEEEREEEEEVETTRRQQRSQQKVGEQDTILDEPSQRSNATQQRSQQRLGMDMSMQGGDESMCDLTSNARKMSISGDEMEDGEDGGGAGGGGGRRSSHGGGSLYQVDVDDDEVTYSSDISVVRQQGQQRGARGLLTQSMMTVGDTPAGRRGGAGVPANVSADLRSQNLTMANQTYGIQLVDSTNATNDDSSAATNTDDEEESRLYINTSQEECSAEEWDGPEPKPGRGRVFLKPRRVERADLSAVADAADEGVRRSTRNRMAPVRRWLGEEPVYATSPGGSRTLRGTNRVEIVDARMIKQRTADPHKVVEREMRGRERRRLELLRERKARAEKRRRHLRKEHERGENLDTTIDSIETSESEEEEEENRRRPRKEEEQSSKKWSKKWSREKEQMELEMKF